MHPLSPVIEGYLRPHQRKKARKIYVNHLYPRLLPAAHRQGAAATITRTSTETDLDRFLALPSLIYVINWVFTTHLT